MNVTELELPGVLLIEPTYFEDFRGYYTESYSARTMAQYGIHNVFVQDNHLLSLKRGTLRGIHFQNAPMGQAKLLRCTRGKIQDVVVDLRKDSPTYRKWLSVELSEENRKQIYIPCGFGHACLSLADNVEVQYKVDNLYTPELDRAIAWNDPQLAIRWEVPNEEIIVSPKDTKAPTLAQSDVNFTAENCE